MSCAWLVIAVCMQALRAIYLNNNHIATEASGALICMLEQNPSIVTLECNGAHFNRGFSPVHHHSTKPLLNEGGTQLVEAVKRNQVESMLPGSINLS